MKNFHLKEQFFLSFFLSFFLRFCLNIELVEFNLARNVKIIAATSNSKVSSLTSLSRRGNSNSKCQRQSYTHGPRFSLLFLSLSLSLFFYLWLFLKRKERKKEGLKIWILVLCPDWRIRSCSQKMELGSFQVKTLFTSNFSFLEFIPNLKVIEIS